MGATSAGKRKGCDCTAIEGQQHCQVDDAIGFWMHCLVVVVVVVVVVVIVVIVAVVILCDGMLMLMLNPNQIHKRNNTAQYTIGYLSLRILEFGTTSNIIFFQLPASQQRKRI